MRASTCFFPYFKQFYVSQKKILRSIYIWLFNLPLFPAHSCHLHWNSLFVSFSSIFSCLLFIPSFYLEFFAFSTFHLPLFRFSSYISSIRTNIFYFSAFLLSVFCSLFSCSEFINILIKILYRECFTRAVLFCVVHVVIFGQAVLKSWAMQATVCIQALNRLKTWECL